MVRMAYENDIDGTAEIFCELQNAHAEVRPDRFKAADRNIMRDMLSDVLIDRECDAAVSENGGRINGYAVFRIADREDTLHFAERRCIIEQFAVKNEFKRQGIGRELMDFIRKYAEKRKCDSIELSVWYDNFDAVDFYAEIGFVPKQYKMEIKL